MLDDLLRLPLTFAAAETKPLLTLLSETGFNVGDPRVTVDGIVRRLQQDPSLIEVWQNYSYDKRGSPSWYWRPCPHGEHYEVGFYPTGPVFVFEGQVHACAEFIIRELAHLGALIPNRT